jgi:hypothetical protein
MALEEQLELGLKRRVVNSVMRHEENVCRPGEFETAHEDDCPRRDEQLEPGFGCWCGGGILYSPDLLIFNGNTRCGEIKLTSMSAKGAPWKLGETYAAFDPKFDKYFTQMKCYCRNLNTLHARLYMFSIREMVYFNDDSILRGWNITFDQTELDEEWNWLLAHAREEGLLK